MSLSSAFKKGFLFVIGLFSLCGLFACFICFSFYKHILKEENKVKIIAAANNEGQLANQLWHFARLAAFCKERGYEFYNPAFFHYAKYFEHFHDDVLTSPTNPLKLHLPHVQELQRRAYRILRGLLKTSFQEKRFYCCDEKHPLVLAPSSLDFPELEAGNYFFFDWNFTNPVGLEKHREYLKEILKPKACFAGAIDAFWKDIDKNRLIVGVHIRHKDFRFIKNGALFFSVEEIKTHMQKIVERYKSLNPLFIIYSDEKRSKEEFEEFDVFISNENLVVDIFSMARCHLIMGVGKSTYNEWAAWWGNVPRYTYEAPPPSWSEIDTHFSKIFSKTKGEFL